MLFGKQRSVLQNTKDSVGRRRQKRKESAKKRVQNERGHLEADCLGFLICLPPLGCFLGAF